jgi:hypothetical protein
MGDSAWWVEDGIWVREADGTPVARADVLSVSGGQQNDAAREAALRRARRNAAKIAAVPELIEALRGLCDAYARRAPRGPAVSQEPEADAVLAARRLLERLADADPAGPAGPVDSPTGVA